MKRYLMMFVSHVKVATVFMKAGVLIDKTDCFQEILEERSFRLTSCDHLHHNTICTSAGAKEHPK